MKLEAIIKKKLLDTRKCRFKQALLPKGWTIININRFAKELARVINKIK